LARWAQRTTAQPCNTKMRFAVHAPGCDGRLSVGNDSPCTRDDCRIGYAADAHNKQANAWQPNAGRALLPKHALDIKPKPHASSMPTEIAEFKHPRVLPVEQELPPECHCERKLGMRRSVS